MALDTIATELVFMVTDHLEIESFASLLFANRTLYHCLTQKFHRRAISDDGGVSALLHAASTSNLTLATTLLSAGAIPNLFVSAPCDIRAITPLHIAALAGNLPLCRLLVQYGADPHVAFHLTSPLRRHLGGKLDATREYMENLTPLGCAVCHEHAALTVFLLDAMDAQDAGNWFSHASGLFEFAMEQGYISILSVFISREDVDADALTWFLRPTVAAGNPHIVEMMLRAGADVEGRPNNWRPLHVAAHRGHVGVIRVLLRHEAEVDSLSHAKRDQPKTALVVAARTAVMGLSRSGLAKIPDEEREAEVVRMQQGAREAAILLVDNGADVDFAIHLVYGLIATQSEKTDVTRFLEDIRTQETHHVT
ncbi:ankyrin repeat-containing domain protein [Tricharina praecox]|uniref:ankyrin repeat-containing domain protein n=1 Tax=Tricharina praecox TaxID=43433 RepID=UPI00221F57C1|nr:ankyrin repeat-containing domain protein [Tricharina praecox]KAI5847564.1 ankyrin repeat-containing domain protein [Tricharina praecox]